MPHHQISHLEQPRGQLFNAGIYFRVKAIVVAIFPEVLIQIVKGNLIRRFVLAVLITMLLHCVVRQMDELIHTLGAVFLATGPHVSLTVKPDTIVGVERPDADVELPAIVEQGIDVLLHYVGLVLGEGDQRLGDVLDKGLFGLVDCDAVSAV